MKKILLSAVLLLICNYGFSQKATPSKDCYEEWYKAFQKYGATVVADGTHEVIVSLCEGDKCECYLGKVEVSGGKLVPGTLMIQQDDGSFLRPERTLSPKYKASPDAGLPTDIFDGMSPAYLTSQDEVVHILFYKNLNKIPKKQKKAPSPAQLGIK